LILETLFLLLPAYLANMTPVFVRKLNVLDFPLDFGMRLRGRPLFGANKTFRGVLFGSLAAVMTAFMQYLVHSVPFFRSISLLDYQDWLLIGLLLGVGALLGDAVESLFKRQLGINPGERFLPWDQLDFVVGALLLLSVAYVPPLKVILTALIASFLLHIGSVRFAYYLGIRKEKW
jgi:CDP-2,3-bis-(O-geranylgeranyl)-sn-glycerol synthase